MRNKALYTYSMIEIAFIQFVSFHYFLFFFFFLNSDFVQLLVGWLVGVVFTSSSMQYEYRDSRQIRPIVTICMCKCMSHMPNMPNNYAHAQCLYYYYVVTIQSRRSIHKANAHTISFQMQMCKCRQTHTQSAQMKRGERVNKTTRNKAKQKIMNADDVDKWQKTQLFKCIMAWFARLITFLFIIFVFFFFGSS